MHTDILHQEIPPPTPDAYNHQSHLNTITLLGDRSVGERYHGVRQFKTYPWTSPLTAAGWALLSWRSIGTTPARCFLLDRLAQHLDGAGSKRFLRMMQATYKLARAGMYTVSLTRDTEQLLGEQHLHDDGLHYDFSLMEAVLNEFTADEILDLMQRPYQT
jgi:hypothetical protein